MTQEENHSLRRIWKEFWGRKRVMEPIPYDETAITTQPVQLRVMTDGHYFSLPSMTAAVLTSPTGQKQVFLDGGYKELKEGAYMVQYVDMSERLFTFSNVSASTTNGSDVSMTVSITYKVDDPIQVINASAPLQTLYSVCEGAIKNFIITHRHDEIIGEIGNENLISDYYIIQHIKEQITMNRICRAFWVMDVMIKERTGDPEIGTLKHVDLVQEKRSLTELHKVIQQQGIAEEHKVVATKKAEEDQIVKELQALTEANRSEILKQARLLEIELEALRKQPDMQQERILKIIDAKRQALENLFQLSKTAGFPRDENDIRLMEKIVSSLSETPNEAPKSLPQRLKPENELSSTIINLITPKKKDENKDDQSE